MDVDRNYEDNLLNGLTNSYEYYNNSSVFYLENIAENRKKIENMTVLVVWWNTAKWWYYLILAKKKTMMIVSCINTYIFGCLFYYQESWYFLLLSLILPFATVSSLIIEGTIECITKSKLRENYVL